MGPQTLKFKVSFYLTIALSVAMLAFTVLVVRHQREALLTETGTHVTGLSEAITRSTRFAMLQNQPSYVDSILHDVARQEGIAKVRIFNKEGRIIHSSHPPEVGETVNRKAEGCSQCHQSEKPLASLPISNRSRTFSTADGRRMLGSMEVIRNEPSCYNAACHVHTKAQTVLGVLDIVYSLEDIDRTLQRNTVNIAVFAFGFILVAAFGVGIFVHRLVYRPLRDLEGGAKRLAAGNLDEPIPVRSADEFGQLAASFNTMTEALRKSQQELQEWGRTLEVKVAERTQKLHIAEVEAARREKLASVGMLAAGIAHELNNPLTGVLTFSTLLRRKIPDGSQDAEDIDLVIRETRRCATIIRRLLDFAREKPPEKKFVDLNRMLEETTRLVERPANLRDIAIVMELAADVPALWVDEDLIKQVVVNMLVNAQQAIGAEGGRITIRSRICPEPRRPDPGSPPVPMVEISIVDTGCGIAENDLRRIFDPFFTTKGVGQGTGLGLSVSHGIVKAHGGAIEVESEVGVGTQFRVYLPLESPASGEASGGSH